MHPPAAHTPIWSKAAKFPDFVLPMGHASERHYLMSQETHSARWIGFRQPVLRVALERQGKRFENTWQAHREAGLGEVWEEEEFWIELSWRVDPDGSLGIRKYFESPFRPGEKLTVEEYYRWIFENSVPGLPEAAAKEGLTPLDYMRRYGAALGYFSTPGSADAGLYAQGDPVTGFANDKPDSKGWIGELDWVPYENTKFALQYTMYNKFNGGDTNYDGTGRNAKDNNTLYLLSWINF